MSAWHFVEQYSNPFVTAWNCDTGEFLMGDNARQKMAEVGGVAIPEKDIDRRQWWALANPELAKGLKWWAMPTPDDAPMAGPVSPFRGGWKDYSDKARMPFAPAGASPLTENGYDVNEPKET